MYRLFLAILISFYIPLTHAWTPGLLDAAKAVAEGNPTNAQKVMVHIHRAEVSRMALKNPDFQKNVFPEVEKLFNETNRQDIQKIAEEFGCVAEAKVSSRGPNPGSDTDVAVRPIDPNEKLTLDKIRKMDQRHKEMLRARAQKEGVPFKNSDIDNDFLPDPDYTTDAEFEKIAKYINDEKGGTAYRTRKAAKAEIKLSQGKDLTPDEIGIYNQEMKWQQQRKAAKNKANFDELSKARKAQDFSKIQDFEARIQLNQSQQAKYTQRVRKLNDTMREKYGLEPLRRDIKGADAAIDILDTAGRNATTAMEASTVGALSESAMLKAQEEFADTLIDAGKNFKSARNALPHVLNDLPPSAKGNMIARMEQTLGAEETTDIIRKAKILNKTTSQAVLQIADKMKSDLNFGKKPEFKGGITKVQVAMTALNAVFMAKTGYEITLKNIKPDDTDLEMFGKMVANSLYYGSGIGENFDQSMAEEMERYQQAYLRGEGPSLTGHITATFLKTGLRMGKDTIEGILYLPDGIAHLLAWGRDWASGAGAAKEYAYAQNALADAMQKVILDKKAFKEAMAMVDKYGVHPEDARAYLNCLCRDCGGSLGGSYNPGWDGPGHGPCVCSGPLSMWKTRVNTDSESGLRCLNQVTKSRYNQDQAIFNKWRNMAKRVNAESVQKEVDTVKAKTAKMDENWKENAVEAAKIFNGIQDMMLEKDKAPLQDKLSSRLISMAHHKVVDDGNIRQAIKDLKLAEKVGGRTDSVQRRLKDYERWQKPWDEVLAKKVPEVRNAINKGRLEQAQQLIQQVNFKMSAQGGRIYPPTNDPRWRGLQDLYDKKAEEMRLARIEEMKKEAKQTMAEASKNKSPTQTTMRTVKKVSQTAKVDIAKDPSQPKQAIDKLIADPESAPAELRSVAQKAPSNQPQVISKTGYQLKLAKTIYAPNESIKLAFSTPSEIPRSSWVGLIPSHIHHGSEKRNNQNDTSYHMVYNKRSGEMLFKAPLAEGRYDLRMSTPEGNQEMISVSFRVEVPKHSAILLLPKKIFAPNEKIELGFNASPLLPNNTWVGLLPAGIHHGSTKRNNQHDITYQTVYKKASGKRVFTAPRQEGTYDFRMNETTNDKELASVTFEVKVPMIGNELSLPKDVFAPNEKIPLEFKASPLLPNNSWVGLLPANIHHGSTKQNNEHDINYQTIYGKKSGQMVFKAPAKEGSYDFRMNETTNDKELTSVAFKVAVPMTGNEMTLNKKIYAPNEKIIMNFKASPLLPNNTWIGLLPANINHGSQAHNNKHDMTYQTVYGKASGQMTFKAPNKEGEFDFRMNETTNDKELVSVPFKVSVPMSGNQLSLNKKSYAPGEKITLNFKASPLLPNNTWIGMIPSHIHHGSQALNNKHDITYQTVYGKTSGQMTFTAPKKSGRYDFRMNETTNDKEVASVSFSVQ